ncbi:MAG: PKD domain-containing protein [Planctomycetes bacterium]|nr:PKD domain-containing protein [Planctomycetota bacterium]
MKRASVRVFLMLAGVLAVAGCGGGGDDGGGTDPGVRIGRGVEEPTGVTETVDFQDGAGGYFGTDDYVSSGDATYLHIESVGGGTITYRSYIRFDLASAGLPVDAMVVSASVTLTVHRENGCGQGSDFLELRHLTESWTGSGDRAYYAPPNPAEGTLLVPALPDGSGGDPNVLPTPEPIIVPLSETLVQGWIDNAASNQGMAIVPSVDSNGMELHMYTSAASTVSYRPKLTVTYTTDANQSPTASVAASPTSGNVPLNVSFTGSGTDPDGTITAWRYDFDDGGTAFDQSTTHEYTEPGTYFVNFTVQDDGGKMDTDIVVITVSDPVTPTPYPSIGYHPAGGEPGPSAESCASWMARPCPSSRRHVLVWHDQIDFNPATDEAQACFAARKMVGSQKMPQDRIEVVRPFNTNWRVLQYHLSYGLTRVGDWVDKNVYDDEKVKFDAWMSSHGYGNTQLGALIINSSLSTYMSNADSPDWDTVYGQDGLFDHALRNSSEFYYVYPAYDPGGGPLWHRYIIDETIRRMQMNDAGYNFDGTFFDTAHEPGPNLSTYCGASAANWYNNADVCTIATNTEYADWWNARAGAYFGAVRAAYSSGNRYLVLPNCNRMTTGWYDPEYLLNTDGGFAESFGCTNGTQTLVSSGAGVWETSIGRTVQYITGAKKVLLAVPTPDVSSVSLREFCVATFLLIKNDTSYYSLNASGLGSAPNGYGGNPRWYPEYEITIGEYLDDCPADLGDLRVAGTSGGGLYARWYTGGLVLVNSSPSTTYGIELDRTYYPVSFSGGGYVATDGSKPAMSLATGGGVSGTYNVPPGTGRILSVSP